MLDNQNAITELTDILNVPIENICQFGNCILVVEHALLSLSSLLLTSRWSTTSIGGGPTVVPAAKSGGRSAGSTRMRSLELHFTVFRETLTRDVASSQSG